MTFTRSLSTNNYGTAKFIVDGTTVANGSHSTIATALTSASSGDTIFIRPGSYDEDLTLKAGVNLTAYACDAQNAQVTILGKCTATFAGTADFSGIQFKTQGDYCISVTGSAATILNFTGCYINADDNTAIEFTSSSSSSVINITRSEGNIQTTGIAFFASTSAGQLVFRYSNLINNGASTTASTISAGSLTLSFCRIGFPITSSSTAALAFRHSDLELGSISAIAVIAGGSGAQNMRKCYIATNTATALTATTTLGVIDCIVDTVNVASIDGAGTLEYSNITFDNVSIITTTTQTAIYNQLGKYKASGQPAFLAYLPSADLNQTGNGTVYTLGAVTAVTELFDQDSNFTTAGVFTAPVAGRYAFNLSALVNGCTAATVITITIITTKRAYNVNHNRAGSASDLSLSNSVLADMDATDTATFTIKCGGEGADTDDISGGAGTALWTQVSGNLMC